MHPTKPSLLDMEAFAISRSKRKRISLSETFAEEFDQPQQPSVDLSPAIEAQDIHKVFDDEFNESLTDRHESSAEMQSQIPTDEMTQKLTNLADKGHEEIAASIEDDLEDTPEINSLQEDSQTFSTVQDKQNVNQQLIIETIQKAFSELALPKKDNIHEIVNVLGEHKSEILYLRTELDKLKSAIEPLKDVLEKQKIIPKLQDEIRELKLQITVIKQRAEKRSEPEKTTHDAIKKQSIKPKEPVDDYYKRLILKNIMMLKDEKGFSSLDVAKLFQKEGFSILPPYDVWDKDAINKLYAQAKMERLRQELPNA
ncbi:MAG: hypothetical protein HQK77_09450 [Desulfobacterales bacterium]|nr:hypothetical protein [Desulfobacterales bacterium]